MADAHDIHSACVRFALELHKMVPVCPERTAALKALKEVERHMNAAASYDHRGIKVTNGR